MAAAANMVLILSREPFAFSVARYSAESEDDPYTYRWRDAGLSWTDGEEVEVGLSW